MLCLFFNLSSCARLTLGSMLGGLTTAGSLLSDFMLCADSGLAEIDPVPENERLNADGGAC